MTEWTRRQFLAAAAMAKPRKKRPRPNVLLILTDSLSLRAIGAAGNKHIKTPNIDSLVRGGTSFVNSWCAAPESAPSRASLMTGCMPHTAGVDRAGQKIDAKAPTMAELFKMSSYDCMWVGQWDLPAASPGARIPNIPPTPPPPEESRGFEFLTFPVNDKSQEPFGDFTDERIAQSAANYVTKLHTSPFLLGMSLRNPHDIAWWVEDKLPKGHPGPLPKDIPDGKLPPLPANFQGDQPDPATSKWDEKRWRQYLYAYYRMIERMDYCIGVVLVELRRRKMEENMIVVLTSTRGQGLGAHRQAAAPALYQESLSVPLIIQWRDWVQANRVEKNALASGIDVLPTLCDLAGVPSPKYKHGESLRPVLESTNGTFRQSAFAELPPDGRAVRTDQWKYIVTKKGEMLFDLHADPGETKNLIAAGQHKEALDMCRQLLAQWAESDRLK